MLDESIDELIQLALAEDIGAGDVTAEFFIPPDATALARIVAREKLVVAGTETAAAVFAAVDDALAVKTVREDGKIAAKGDVVMEISGSTRSVVTAERVALNFLQRLSGVATETSAFVNEVSDLPVRILDTRKTTPGWRRLEKAAVAAGGGKNHRMGLYDQVMVKDNHLLAEGSGAALGKAIEEVKSARPGIVVELEADTLDQVKAFLGIEGVDIILLDNMTPEEMRKAVSMGGGKVKLEASGGVTLETVRAVAETGVDFISVGAITHSARSVDLSLELDDDD